ncbi:MAG: T9SS type A sorting domain-containing protein [bacterium]
MLTRSEKCFLISVILMPVLLAAIPEVQIRQNDVPFVIGTSARYEQNADLFEWTPFDSMRTWWDLTVYPGGGYARVKLLNPSQGIPPAPDTFPNAQVIELDTLGDNSAVWSYLSENQIYLYVQGIDFETGGIRFIGNYQPDYKCYFYPIYDGGGWNTAWTWTYYIDGWLPYTANETHQKVVVAKGKVRVPFSGNHFWPCLVIRDYMEFTDNFGTVDTRWIYEWVVPGRFGGANGVAAAQSTNGASQNFMIVDNFLKLSELYVPGWDVHGPEFANTTIWQDTSFAGPFIVQSTITDSTGIGTDSLFYKINGGDFIGVGHDSIAGNVYYFHIPEVAQSCTLGYFIWAEDSFCVANGVDLWHTDPICAPESTYYKFVASTGVEESRSQQLTNKTNFRVYPTLSGTEFTISFAIPEDFQLKIYNASGRLVKDFVQFKNAHLNIGRVKWQGDDNSGCKLPAGVYFVQIKTKNWQKTQNIVLMER